MMTDRPPTYSQHKPTAFDRHIHLEDREHWLIAPVSQTRDSCAMDRVNFSAALEILGGESDTVEVHRFGHWGPGWYEIVLVDPADETAVKKLDDITRSLEDYPILDEEKLSETEYEEARDAWDSYAADDAARDICRTIGLWPGATDRLAEFLASDDGWRWWMDHNSAPYEHDSSGPYFPGLFRFSTHGRVTARDRANCAELLRKVRNWEQQQKNATN